MTESIKHVINTCNSRWYTKSAALGPDNTARNFTTPLSLANVTGTWAPRADNLDLSSACALFPASSSAPISSNSRTADSTWVTSV